MKDIRYALRQFINAPVFTATAVLTLALGIGATTAIFTLVHAVLLNSLPVARPSELYRVGDVENCCVNGGLQDDWALFSYDKYKTFRDNTPGFVEMAAFQAGHDLVGVRRAGSSQPARSMRSEFVSGNYFAMFGIGPYAGRVVMPHDDRKGASPVAVISYHAWQQKFGADPAVVGAAFSLNGQPFTVVGIAPPGFFGDRLADPPEFFIPIADEPLIDDPAALIDFPQQDWLDIIGRVTPGADPKQIGAHLQVELQQWLLSPIAQLQPGERSAVSKQTLRLSPGGGGVQALRDEYQTSNFYTSRAGGDCLDADSASAYRECGVSAAGRDRGSSDRVRRDQFDFAPRVSKHIHRDSRFAVAASARFHICNRRSDRSSLRRGSGMDHRQCGASRCAPRCGAFHRA
jgi:hypothetical protein